MEIAQTPPAISPTSASVTEPSAISSDFDTFLRMLTVQLQNQDPLNPIESSDYAVQLATFSGVEQQVQTNDLLRNLATQMGASGMVQLANWVGKEARATVSADFSGQPITVVPTIAEGADDADLIVLDTDGNELQSVTIGTSTEPLEWAGVTTDGAPFPPGSYRFDVVSYAGEEELSRTQAAVYDRVTEVQVIDGVANLILGSGAIVPASDVTALRDPSG